MENAEIAKIFNEIADMLDIKGENPFRVRSYRNAGLVLEGLPLSVKSIVEKDEKELDKIPGIGKSIHEKIVEMLRTGKCAFHDELLKEVGAGLLELLKVPGVGPKKAALFVRELGVKGVEDVERAAKKGLLRALPGMGEKSESKIVKALEEYKNLKISAGRFRLSVAEDHVRKYLDYMKGLAGVIDAEVAGSVRRWKDTIGDADILITCKRGTPAGEHFVKYPEVREVVAKGDTKSTVILTGGLQVDLRVLDKASFGSALQYFTGSKSHNIAVRDRAKKMGLKISEYGVFDEKTGKKIAGEKEDEVYRAIGLEWMPPELRENRGEIEAAEKNTLPRLIELKDIKGDLHAHTNYSDGSSTIEEMAVAAIERGYEYLAITDHSRAVGIAHGLDAKRLVKQAEEIDAVNERLSRKGNFRLLKGVEVDIKADGSLDLPAEALKKLDCVVGAVHSKFDMSERDMTERITKAMATGCLHIIAHPTGRLIGMREPYDVDMELFVSAAKKYGVALEVNSYPERLDLNDANCKLAKEKGAMVSVSTDSHSHLQLAYILYGVHTARRGWLERKDVLNALQLKELLKALGK
jgi:DNA polymerase (family 10)